MLGITSAKIFQNNLNADVDDGKTIALPMALSFVNCCSNTWLTVREDVRGVAGVALATPFFQDLFYIPSKLLAIWSSGHPVFWPSDHPAI